MALYSALFVAVFAVVGASIGALTRRTALARVAALALPWSTALTGLALVGLTLALVQGDLTLRYVAQEITLTMPGPDRAAALATGAAGGRLVFAFLLCLCATIALAARDETLRNARARVALTSAPAFALAWSALGAPPFARLTWQLNEGGGHAASLPFSAVPILTLVSLLGAALLVVAGALALERGRHQQATSWLLAAWVCHTAAFALGVRVGERLTLASWPPRGAVTLAVILWVAISIILLVPRVRRRWWPDDRRAARTLAATFAVAAVLALAGGAGRLARTIHIVTLGQGESASRRDAFGRSWSFAQQGISAFRARNREVLAVSLEGIQAGRRVLLVTERSQYIDSRNEEVGAPHVRSAVARGLLQDVSLTLLRIQPNDAAQLRITFTPLGAWLWAGVPLMIAAGVTAWAVALRRTL